MTLRYFRWEVNVALGALALTLFIAANIWLVSQVHGARRQAARVCAEQVRVEIRRKPILQHVVHLSDPCLTLARVRGEE